VYTIAVGIVDRVIAVVDPASNQAKIYVGPQTLRQWNAQWSPDGKWLAFQGMEGRDSSGREGPVLLDPETGEWRFLAVRSEGKSMYFSSWRPDSKAILVHDMFTLFQIDLNGRIVHSAKIEDMNGRDVAGSCRFLVSPDGNMVIFDDIALPDAEKFPQTMAIYAYSFSEKKRIRLTPQGLSAAQPLWYKPGDEIIFTGTEAATPNVYRLWLADRKPVCIMKNAVSGSVGNVAEKK
jgi:Tol biopolymer transport system component